MNKELPSVPEVLANNTNEYCLESCMGMVLASFDKLGTMSLEDIVEAVSIPGEEYTPIERYMSWIENFGLQITILGQESEENTIALKNAGFDVRYEIVTIDMIQGLLDDGASLFTLFNHSGDHGEDDFYLDHVAYIKSSYDDQVSLLDPDVENQFVISKIQLESIWGRYPNLFIFTER